MNTIKINDIFTDTTVYSDRADIQITLANVDSSESYLVYLVPKRIYNKVKHVKVPDQEDLSMRLFFGTSAFDNFNSKYLKIGISFENQTSDGMALDFSEINLPSFDFILNAVNEFIDEINNENIKIVLVKSDIQVHKGQVLAPVFDLTTGKQVESFSIEPTILKLNNYTE